MASTSDMAAPRDYEFSIEGMSCASCVAHVEEAIAHVPGVASASVNLATERASVTMRAPLDPQVIEKAVRDAGYDAHWRAPDGQAAADAAAQQQREAEELALRRDVITATVLTLPVFVLEMGAHLIPGFHHWIMATIGEGPNHWVQAVLATAVLLGPGRRFFARGIPALLRRRPDMNSLVVVGASAAWLYSMTALLFPQVLPEGTVHVYFEAAAVIVTLVLVGRMLEARARGRTSDAIRRLTRLRPKSARVRREGAFVEIAVEEIGVGDEVQLRPGERVPVDGSVSEGESFVDESMLTGEPVPVMRRAGDPVIGGSIVTTGSLVMRVEKIGGETMLAAIIRLVENAQGGKLPIQSLVDRVTNVFVPVVMALSVLTFVLWLAFGPAPALNLALVNAVAVLIIACPCAMGLATPTSIMVGSGRAAEWGILMRKGEALQRLRDVGLVAFDKTGTLTEGNPELTDFITAPGMARQDVLALLAAAESGSEHPLGETIVRAAEAEGLAIAAAHRFETISGQGVMAEVAGRRVLVGAASFMAAQGVDVGALASDADRLAQEGKSPIYGALDGDVAALLAVADPEKPTSRAAIAALHAMGIRTVMITGDNKLTAGAVAARLGIDDVMAQVLPAGKAEAVQHLRATLPAGKQLAFVGDGINDAPALAEADIGIAIGSGTDVAIESADVVLVSGDVGGVPNAIHLSRATMRNIAENLFWAFAYNVVLIPVAAGVLFVFGGPLLSPMLAAGAMALSSLFVVGNALRLRGVRPAFTRGESAA